MKTTRSFLALAALAACSQLHAAPILWVGDSSGRLGTVDVATGAATVIGSMGRVMTDIAFDPSGNLWGTDGGALFSIDASTGASTLVGNMGIGFQNALVFSSSGVLYAAGASLYTVNTSTGAGSLVGAGNGYSSSGDLAFVGGNLYLASGPTANDSLWEIDETTGVGTNIGAIGAGAVYGLATPDNTTLYGLSGQSIYSINTSTGAGSLIVSYAGGLGAAYGTAFRTEAGAPIPEPSALSLVGLALAGLGWVARRRKA